MTDLAGTEFSSHSQMLALLGNDCAVRKCMARQMLMFSLALAARGPNTTTNQP